MSKEKNVFERFNQLIIAGERIVAATKEIAECGEILIHTAKDIQSIIAPTSEVIEVQPTQDAVPVTTCTREEVRGVLAEKASAGYREQVKDLLNKYGASQLKDINPNDYGALMNDALVLGNG